MLQQFSIIELIKQIQKTVLSGTGKKCYDHVEKGQASPFYYAELVQTKPANTKTMYVTEYTVNIHVVSESGKTSVPLFKEIQALEETMTADIDIPEPYELIYQMYNGIQSTYKEKDTNEKHAVLNYTFKVCYGYMMK